MDIQNRECAIFDCFEVEEKSHKRVYKVFEEGVGTIELNVEKKERRSLWSLWDFTIPLRCDAFDLKTISRNFIDAANV